MDDWLKDDPFFDPNDPDAAERERRRQEREERRRARQQKRDQGHDVPTTGETAVPAPQQEPQPQRQREPRESAPRRAPFADRVAEMRRRAGETRIPRPSVPRRKPRSDRGAGGTGSGGGGFGATLLANWGKIALGIAGIILVWLLFALFQPFHGSGHGRVTVTIPKGASTSEIGDLLEQDGVISSSFMFEVRATIGGDRGDLQSGTFTFKKDMSYSDAISELTTSPQQRGIITLTLPEGYSRSQYAPIVKQQAGVNGYLAASKHSKFLKPSSYGAKGAKNLEGFLFPDTYQAKYGSAATNVVQLQLQDFKRRIKGVNMKYARSKNLTTYDILIIASMLERESGPQDFSKVAAVIYNRLHNGTPLGIDATIRFAVGNYTQPLTQSQLSTPSPYNTRINAGLPPGPIGNPGLAAIEAAAHPAKVNFLFYVTKPGTCNRLAFATTDAQFQALVNQYNSARAAAGGRSPDTC